MTKLCRVRDGKLEVITSHSTKGMGIYMKNGLYKPMEVPYSKHEFWKLKDSSLGLVEDNIIADEDKNLAKDRELRYKRLEKAFTEKWLGIKRLIIDKPYMTDKEAINSQIESYEKLGIQAEKRLVNAPDNPQLQAIVNKYHESLDIQFTVNLLTQQIRGLIEEKIEANDDIADVLLNKVESINLTREQLTDPNIIENIKNLFIQ